MTRCSPLLLIAPCSLFALSTTTSSALVFPPASGGRRAAFGVRPPSWVSSSPSLRSSSGRLWAYKGTDAAVDRRSSPGGGRNDTAAGGPLIVSIPSWTSLGETTQPYQTQSLVREARNPSSFIGLNTINVPQQQQQPQPTPTEASSFSFPSALPFPVALLATVALLAATLLGGSELVSPSLVGGVTLSSATAWVAEALHSTQGLVTHPQESLQAGLEVVRGMGPMGYVYFGILYAAAEILAVPATPLTLSAGYLFGVLPGTAVVLLAATVAASVAFVVGKTILRTWVEDRLLENPQFAKLDKAIGREGFKLLLLVRLSPLFPFALSNYLYGASSIDFPSYFWGTLLGFAPGTLAYVYAGSVGQALTLGGDAVTQPWYVYAGGMAVITGLLKLATDVATGLVESLDDESNDNGGSDSTVPKAV